MVSWILTGPAKREIHYSLQFRARGSNGFDMNIAPKIVNTQVTRRSLHWFTFSNLMTGPCCLPLAANGQVWKAYVVYGQSLHAPMGERSQQVLCLEEAACWSSFLSQTDRHLALSAVHQNETKLAVSPPH